MEGTEMQEQSCPQPLHEPGVNTAPPVYVGVTNTVNYLPADTQDPGIYSQHRPQVAHVVVTAQPTVILAPMVPYQPAYLGYSIFTMLFCCLPIGLIALIFSIKTKDANSRGDMVVSQDSSSMTRTLNHVALGIGIAVHLAWIAYVIFVAVTIRSIYNSVDSIYYDVNGYYHG